MGAVALLLSFFVAVGNAYADAADRVICHNGVTLTVPANEANDYDGHTNGACEEEDGGLNHGQSGGGMPEDDCGDEIDKPGLGCGGGAGNCNTNVGEGSGGYDEGDGNSDGCGDDEVTDACPDETRDPGPQSSTNECAQDACPIEAQDPGFQSSVSECAEDACPDEAANPGFQAAGPCGSGDDDACPDEDANPGIQAEGTDCDGPDDTDVVIDGGGDIDPADLTPDEAFAPGQGGPVDGTNTAVAGETTIPDAATAPAAGGGAAAPAGELPYTGLSEWVLGLGIALLLGGAALHVAGSRLGRTSEAVA